MAIDGSSDITPTSNEAELSTKLESFQSKKTDSLITRFGKMIKRAVKRDQYRLLKSQLGQVLQKERPLSERKISKSEDSSVAIKDRRNAIKRPPLLHKSQSTIRIVLLCKNQFRLFVLVHSRMVQKLASLCQTRI